MDTMTYASVAALPWSVAQNKKQPVVPGGGVHHFGSVVHHPIMETMKMRILLALAGLAIGFAVPVLALNFSGDVKALGEFNALGMKYDEAYNKNDAVALAALFVEDAVVVTDTGPIYGREAIEKQYADVFQKWHYSNHIDKRDQYSPHIMRTAGNEPWSDGEWLKLFKARWALFDSEATGQRFMFVRAMLGRERAMFSVRAVYVLRPLHMI